MDLSVVILSYNTKQLLLDCLKSIFSQTKDVSYEVIVVDNASTDGSVETVAKFTSEESFGHLGGGRLKQSGSPALPAGRHDSSEVKVKLIVNKKNLGFAKGNNIGIKEAKGDYILLLNSDTLIQNNALEKLVNFAKTKPKAGVVGAKLFGKDGKPQPSIAPFYTLPNIFLMLFAGHFWEIQRKSPDVPTQADWVMGSAFLIKKEVIDKVGYLDVNFFMYIEEVEYCYRIKKAGFEVWFTPDAKITHYFGASSPEGRRFPILQIYKGLVYFYQKHFPEKLWLLKILLRLKAIAVILFASVLDKKFLKETYVKALAIC